MIPMKMNLPLGNYPQQPYQTMGGQFGGNMNNQPMGQFMGQPMGLNSNFNQLKFPKQ